MISLECTGHRIALCRLHNHTLTCAHNHHVCDWFNPLQPGISGFLPPACELWYVWNWDLRSLRLQGSVMKSSDTWKTSHDLQFSGILPTRIQKHISLGTNIPRITVSWGWTTCLNSSLGMREWIIIHTEYWGVVSGTKIKSCSVSYILNRTLVYSSTYQHITCTLELHTVHTVHTPFSHNLSSVR